FRKQSCYWSVRLRQRADRRQIDHSPHFASKTHLDECCEEPAVRSIVISEQRFLRKELLHHFKEGFEIGRAIYIRHFAPDLARHLRVRRKAHPVPTAP